MDDQARTATVTDLTSGFIEKGTAAAVAAAQDSAKKITPDPEQNPAEAQAAFIPPPFKRQRVLGHDAAEADCDELIQKNLNNYFDESKEIKVLALVKKEGDLWKTELTGDKGEPIVEYLELFKKTSGGRSKRAGKKKRTARRRKSRRVGKRRRGGTHNNF